MKGGIFLQFFKHFRVAFTAPVLPVRMNMFQRNAEDDVIVDDLGHIELIIFGVEPDHLIGILISGISEFDDQISLVCYLLIILIEAPVAGQPGAPLQVKMQ